jgi:hypothetical protein
MAALAGSLLKNMLYNNSNTVLNSLISKKDTNTLTGLIRVNTKRHWKKIAFVGACSALIAGGYKIHCELSQWREQQDLAPNQEEEERLEVVSSMVNIQTQSHDDITLICGAIGIEHSDDMREIEDVLVVDEVDSECLRVMEDEVKFASTSKGDSVEEVAYANKINVLRKDKAKLERLRKSRKKISDDGFPTALRSLVSRAKLAFPIPRADELQIQSINLFLYKECRKLNLRVTDAAKLIPQAVALACIPSDTQISNSQLIGLPEIQRRFLRRKWKGSQAPLSARVISGVQRFLSR